MLPLLPMLHIQCLFTRPYKRLAQQGLLSLLIHKKDFFPCWCATWSSFPAGALQISYLKFFAKATKNKTCHQKEQIAWHRTSSSSSTDFLLTCRHRRNIHISGPPSRKLACCMYGRSHTNSPSMSIILHMHKVSSRAQLFKANDMVS